MKDHTGKEMYADHLTGVCMFCILVYKKQGHCFLNRLRASTHYSIHSWMPPASTFFLRMSAKGWQALFGGFFLNLMQFIQRAVEGLGLLLLQLQRFIQIILADQPLFNQQLAQVFFGLIFLALNHVHQL